MDYQFAKELPTNDYALHHSDVTSDSYGDNASYAREALAGNDRLNPFSQTELNNLIAARYQHTLAKPVTCRDVGIHSGIQAVMTIHPAPAGHGVVFKRVDVAVAQNDANIALIPAQYQHVANTNHCSLLRNEHGVTIATVEHVMAALAGLKIDNVLIEVNGPEIPIMDGSAANFVELLQQAGRVQQSAKLRWLKILRPVTVENGGRMAQLLPLASDAEDAHDQGHDQYLRIDYDVEFSAPIGHQSFNFDLGRDDFLGEIAAARTFCFDDEVAVMQKHGLGLGGSLDNSVVIVRNPENVTNASQRGDIKVLNPQGLRFMDECVRHKILDAVGDLYLAGAPIIGHYKAHRGGHEMTNLLLRALFSDANNYEFV